MQAVENALQSLIGEIKNTDVYKNYRERLSVVEAEPGLMERINEFRIKNYELQNSDVQDDLFEAIDRLDREYEQLRENPHVSSFLEAELSLCRMIQQVNLKIAEGIDFD